MTIKLINSTFQKLINTFLNNKRLKSVDFFNIRDILYV